MFRSKPIVKVSNSLKAPKFCGKCGAKLQIKETTAYRVDTGEPYIETRIAQCPKFQLRRVVGRKIETEQGHHAYQFMGAPYPGVWLPLD